MRIPSCGLFQNDPEMFAASSVGSHSNRMADHSYDSFKDVRSKSLRDRSDHAEDHPLVYTLSGHCLCHEFYGGIKRLAPETILCAEYILQGVCIQDLDHRRVIPEDALCFQAVQLPVQRGSRHIHQHSPFCHGSGNADFVFPSLPFPCQQPESRLLCYSAVGKQLRSSPRQDRLQSVSGERSNYGNE